MKIYVLRHAQTDGNLNGIIIGRSDIDITKVGQEQAIDAREIIEKLQYDLVICSTLKRAKQTCAIVNTKNIEVLFDDRIIEKNMGVLEGRFKTDIDYENYYTLSRKEYEDEETIEKLLERVYSFLDDILVKYSNKNILLITHNGVCRAINCYFNGIPNSLNLAKLGQKNCEIRKYTYDE